MDEAYPLGDPVWLLQDILWTTDEERAEVESAMNWIQEAVWMNVDHWKNTMLMIRPVDDPPWVFG